MTDETLAAHAPMLRGVARRLCRSAADADDLVQETFERALRARDRYEHRGSEPGWLLTILRNRHLDHCRKARRAPIHLDIASHEVPSSQQASGRWVRVSDEQIVVALDRLQPAFRRTFELFASGRSYDQIAAQLEISRVTVGTRLTRARRQLQRMLVA